MKRFAAILILLMLGAFLSTAIASAITMVNAEEDSDQDGVTDTGEDHEEEPYVTEREDGEEETMKVETEHSKEEEDIEEEMEAAEDEEGDLHINSDDNAIKFERDEPEVRFKYNVTAENMTEFEAGDFALVEFKDLNNDSKVQGDEIRRKLEFEEIPWNFTYTRSVEANNTVITVTYYANATEYEITLVMRIYQRRVTVTSTTGNATLIFDIDGGADEVKFDLIVSRWNWVDESSKLALLMELKSEVKGDVTLESISQIKDQIAVLLDSVKIKLSWVKKAKIVAADGSEKFVNVTVAYKSIELEQELSEIELELEVYFIYPYFGQSKLIHDPSIGIEDDPLRFIFSLLTPELLLGTAVTAAAITAVAFGFSRRKKKLPSLGKVPATTP